MDKIEEDLSAERARVSEIIHILKEYKPNAKIVLNFRNPLELLIATILSAQCTDKKVNEVTTILFTKYKTAEDYAKVDLSILEQDIRLTGFYHNKAKYIKMSCAMMVAKFNGKVPNTMEGLLTLPGVARKTANIVLSNAYGIIEGIAVDTHVKRVSMRLALTKNDNPNKIENDLVRVVPKEAWFPFNYLLIELGREICVAGIPHCEKCPLNRLCPSAFIFS